MVSTKGLTRSAHAAVSEVSAGALLNKALSMCRKRAGEFLHDIRAINAIKFADSDILAHSIVSSRHSFAHFHFSGHMLSCLYALPLHN